MGPGGGAYPAACITGEAERQRGQGRIGFQYCAAVKLRRSFSINEDNYKYAALKRCLSIQAPLGRAQARLQDTSRYGLAMYVIHNSKRYAGGSLRKGTILALSGPIGIRFEPLDCRCSTLYVEDNGRKGRVMRKSRQECLARCWLLISA